MIWLNPPSLPLFKPVAISLLGDQHRFGLIFAGMGADQIRRKERVKWRIMGRGKAQSLLIFSGNFQVHSPLRWPMPPGKDPKGGRTAISRRRGRTSGGECGDVFGQPGGAQVVPEKGVPVGFKSTLLFLSCNFQ